MNTITSALLASAAAATLLAGCATNEQGQLVIDPNRVNQVIVSALTPPPAVVVESEPVYQPMPTDMYVANVVDRDVVIVGGDTYIWAVGPDGIRHRQFYAHGDHRAEVFHRREELHHVLANHDGHLPAHGFGGEHPREGHPGGEHPPFGRPGGPAPGPMLAGHGQPPGSAPMMAGHPQPPHADMHAAAPGRPAPAPAQRPAPKDPKKS
ncbi:hypothetical protein LJ656_02855 [Paraburkholderia sp. MMS20-SJTR3]|uniref:Lipoprotein n=1 Tax=Paraburkholderia sejongensis TaxID=2886946 RepID=A0ABS8JNP8_9BURK|nr:hypothetical protein [Paraburkholderia sp. MMS20-SJTR3]MCC8391514.1 hypothetical protein [Paraburkholderia sp. MMS20-SJTR3]